MPLAAQHWVIYDTDPGVDDAMALYYALANPSIKLLGITTVFGNVTVAQATANALYLTHLTGQAQHGAIPIAQGAAAPLAKHTEAPPDYIHGKDGLGNQPSRSTDPEPRTIEARGAAQFIVDMARQYPGQITLVPVGPLTNIALALQLEPLLPKLIKNVVLMGGAVTEPGNVSPVAEANIWNDPHAADQVFTAGFALTMVGLDATHKMLLPVTLFEQVAQAHKHPATDALLHAVRFYANFYGSRFVHQSGFEGCFGHDVLAFVYLTHPHLFTTETGPIRVVTEGIAQGQTVLQRQAFMQYPQAGWGASMPVSSACMTLDPAAAKAALETALLGPWL